VGTVYSSKKSQKSSQNAFVNLPSYILGHIFSYLNGVYLTFLLLTSKDCKKQIKSSAYYESVKKMQKRFRKGIWGSVKDVEALWKEFLERPKSVFPSYIRITFLGAKETTLDPQQRFSDLMLTSVFADDCPRGMKDGQVCFLLFCYFFKS